MTVDYICREVERLKRKFHETDPFLLCDAMGIILLYEPMGTYPGACKGFFLAQSRKRSITVNSDLPEAIQRIIVTHELGHAVLHAKAVGVKAFHDFELFDSTSLMEYEANIFAAEFLMDDDDVLEKLNEDISFFGAASLLRVPPELLDFKFRLMKRNGYKLIDPPLMANSNFLKNVETEVTDEY
jgi:Zn-dependent peptidase ImmA (M78 family)